MLLTGLLIRRSLTRNYSSIFKRRSNLRLELNSLEDALSNFGEGFNWESVRKEIIAKEKIVNESNLDGIIMRFCSKDRRLDIAKSYAEFLKSKSLEMGDATVGNLLRLYHRHRTEGKSDITEDDEAEILRLCNRTLEKHEMLEATLAENLIHGFCMTKEWLKSIDLIQHIRFSTTPKSPTYSCIISKALDENHMDIVWNLLNQMLSEKLVPGIDIFLKFFKKFARDDCETEKLLNCMSEYYVVVPDSSIEIFLGILKETRETNVVHINRTGHCPSCRSKLPSIKLNEAEFNELSKTFLDSVLIRKDVFVKTNPEEVARFKNFVDKTAPYDCVIDGLNVAFSHGSQQTPAMFAKNVALAVKYFVDKNQSCLVIGRKHMNRWPKDKMDFIRKNSSLFLAENISQDDPFLLYAALRSGPNTSIFTRDLMRGHSFLLDLESKKLFRRWQQQNQYSLITTLQNNKIVVQEPAQFELRAHKIRDCWHIPFTASSQKFTYETFEIPSKWLCMKVGT